MTPMTPEQLQKIVEFIGGPINADRGVESDYLAGVRDGRRAVIFELIRAFTRMDRNFPIDQFSRQVEIL